MLAATAVTDLGNGPGIVLLHGVGAGPGTYESLARHLSSEHRVVVAERPWSPSGSTSLDDQATSVAELIKDLDLIGCTVVGVSGGATLALVIAMHFPELVGAIVAHEPLVGHHAIDLYKTMTDAAQLATRDNHSAIEAVRNVMSEQTWLRTTDEVRSDITAGATRWRAEIPVFVAFDPSFDDLASLGQVPLLVTVGSLSNQERWDAAAVLTTHSRAEVRVVPDSGNAVQLDAAKIFADIVLGWNPNESRTTLL